MLNSNIVEQVMEVADHCLKNEYMESLNCWQIAGVFSTRNFPTAAFWHNLFISARPTTSCTGLPAYQIMLSIWRDETEL